MAAIPRDKIHLGNVIWYYSGIFWEYENMGMHVVQYIVLKAHMQTNTTMLQNGVGFMIIYSHRSDKL